MCKKRPYGPKDPILPYLKDKMRLEINNNKNIKRHVQKHR
jgi:hypothetical protein